MNGGESLTAVNGPAPAERMVDARKLVPVFGAFLAIIVAFVFVDITLVRLVREHRAETGTRLFQHGAQAKQAGRVAEALELYRSAHNLSPANPRYHVAFAETLFANGRQNEAKTSLERLLSSQPAYGPGNAAMARILAKEGDWQNAAWYYHRALYGEWPDNSDLRALRFELAELLAVHNAREQLLAEVLLLDSIESSVPESKRIARLQLAANDWARAETHYRSLLRDNSADPELLAGLARAQFGAGKYVAAERTYRRALHFGASDEAINRELVLVQSINDMDPTLRRLSAAEKHRRAHELVASIVSVLAACSPDAPQIADAQTAMERHNRVRRPLEAAEADLDLFDDLWAARRSLCGPAAEFPEKLRLLATQLEK